MNITIHLLAITPLTVVLTIITTTSMVLVVARCLPKRTRRQVLTMLAYSLISILNAIAKAIAGIRLPWLRGSDGQP